MIYKVPHISQLKKFLQLVFVVWVCGIGPLIYFESLSAHQGVYARRVMFLGMNAEDRLDFPAQLLVAPKSIDYFQNQPDLVLRPLSRRAAHPLLQTMISGELLHTNLKLSSYQFYGRRLIIQPIPLGKSAWLAPPDKPPSSLL